jgi:hypothetical protein
MNLYSQIMLQEFTSGIAEVVTWCAVNGQQIIHYRTSECAIKFVYMLQGMLGGRSELVLAVLEYIKFLSPFYSSQKRCSLYVESPPNAGEMLVLFLLVMQYTVTKVSQRAHFHVN